MEKLNNPTKLAYIYSAASIIIGPLIMILGYDIFTRSGGDYCDAVYYLPGEGVSVIQRATEFHNAQIFQTVSASIMLAIGLTLIASLILNAYKKRARLDIWPILTVLLMIIGYSLVIMMSGSGGQSC